MTETAATRLTPAAPVAAARTGPLAEALERGRARYNARFAAARKGGAAIDGDSFLVHLGNAVGPVVEAVHAEMPDRVDGVLNTLFDVSLELFAASLLGPRSKSPVVGEVWTKLLPPAARLVLRDPKRVAAALSNAAYNLGRTSGVRPRAWVAEMQRVAPRCENVSELLDAGKVAAWRAGMPHYRKSAIATATALRPALAGEMLGVPAEQVAPVLGRMLADPWLAPRAALADEPAALRLVGVVGGFRGFGGEFLRPPTVAASAGSLFVTDGDGVWRLIADCHGRLLIRHDHVPRRPDAPTPDCFVTDEGHVHWGPGRAALPQLAGGVGGFAFDGNRTLAVTLRTSHHVYLVARAPADADADADAEQGAGRGG